MAAAAAEAAVRLHMLRVGPINAGMADEHDPELVQLVDAGVPASKIRRLLREGADVNAPTDQGYGALYVAILNNDAEIVELLLRHGATTQYVDDDGDTLLECAVTNGSVDPEIVSLLLCAGMPVNERVLARAKAEYKWCKPALREERRRIVYMLSWWLFARDCHRVYDRVRVMR